MRIRPLGDTALIVEVGQRMDEPTHHRVQAALRLLESPVLAGVTEVVPAFTTLTLHYDPQMLAQTGAGQFRGNVLSHLIQAVRSRLSGLTDDAVKDPQSQIIEIPVCYGGEFGPDLEQVAAYASLSTEEVVGCHSRAIYLVYLIGFSPGFPYLGGLPEVLTMPRRPVPRTSVPAGSIGIANN